MSIKSETVFKLRWVLLFSISLNLISLYYFIFRCNYYPIFTESGKNENLKVPREYWLGRNKMFEILPKRNLSIVFLGNSLTQNFEWSEFYSNPDILNRGIYADSIIGVLNRINQVTELLPSKIFVELGINDLASGNSAQKVFANYSKLIVALKANSKNTKIYIQSVFPTAVENSNLKNYCNPEVNLEIIKLNEMLKVSAQNGGYQYIDIHSLFYKKGGLKEEYSFDGVHLSSQGYLLWANALRKYIND